MNDLHFAIVVGIDFYPGIRDLRAARDDAREFAKWLARLDGGAVPPTNIEEIIEEGPFKTAADAKPTRDRIDKAFSNFHKAVRKHLNDHLEDWPRTRLYVYFSGHGIAPEAAEVACLMANATSDELGHNIACTKYLNYYKESQDFREVIFFTDCCRTQEKAAPLSPPPFSTVRNNRGRVSAILGFATQYYDVAYEPPAGNGDERGYYTQALLEGLNGAAVDRESPNLGEINSSSLQRYISDRVKKLTEKKKPPQVPDMLGDPADRIVFRVGAARPLHAVTISFPAGFAEPVVLSDGNLNELQQFDSAQGDWNVHLPDGNYEVKPLQDPDGRRFQNEGLFKVVGEARNVQL